MRSAPHLRDEPPASQGQALRDALTDLIRVLQLRDRERLHVRELTVTQCHTLEALEARGSMTLNDLSAALYVDKSTASRVVDGLERKEYVHRRRHPHDGRAVLIESTPQGSQLCREVRNDLAEDYKRLLADFDPAVPTSLTELIRRLAQAAGSNVASAGETSSSLDRQ